MSNKLLTFEVNEDCDQIEIHGNQEGFLELIEALNRVMSGSQHEHLMTPAWGGIELSEERQGEAGRLINKVTVHFWK